MRRDGRPNQRRRRLSVRSSLGPCLDHVPGAEHHTMPGPVHIDAQVLAADTGDGAVPIAPHPQVGSRMRLDPISDAVLADLIRCHGVCVLRCYTEHRRGGRPSGHGGGLRLCALLACPHLVCAHTFMLPIGAADARPRCTLTAGAEPHRPHLPNSLSVCAGFERQLRYAFAHLLSSVRSCTLTYMPDVDATTARTQFADLLRRASGGETFTILRGGYAVATLGPVSGAAMEHLATDPTHRPVGERPTATWADRQPQQAGRDAILRDVATKKAKP